MITGSKRLGPLSDYTANCKTRPLVRDGTPQKQYSKFQTAAFRQEVISGLKSHKGIRYQDILTDWGYKYENLTLQVGVVSDETVKYGYEFWATRTIEWLHCKLQTCPLVREGASQKR
jgi:hypothetical protein